MIRNLSEDDAEIIRKSYEEDPTHSSKEIKNILQNSGKNVQITTVKRAIAAAGLTTAKPRHCQMVCDVNKLKRVQFCKELIMDDDGLDNVRIS